MKTKVLIFLWVTAISFIIPHLIDGSRLPETGFPMSMFFIYQVLFFLFSETAV